jgi:hypothetical protein
MSTNLIEPVLATVTDIYDLDNLGCKSLIEHIAAIQLGLEIGAAGKNETRNVNFVTGDKMLNSKFSNLPDVVVTLFVTKTRETKGRLTTTSMFLGKINGEFVDHIAGVACKSTKKGSVTVHNDESEFLVRFKESLEIFCMEFVIT